MKLTVTTIPPEPVKPEKRYVLEFDEDEATALLHLALCWHEGECSLNVEAKALARSLKDMLNERHVRL